MRAETAGRPEAVNLRRFSQDEFSIGRKRLQSVNALHQFNVAQRGNALYTPAHEAFKARRIKIKYGWIGAIGNGIDGKWQGVAFVTS